MTSFEHLEEAESILQMVNDSVAFQTERSLPLSSADVAYYDTLLRLAEVHVRLFTELRG